MQHVDGAGVDACLGNGRVEAESGRFRGSVAWIERKLEERSTEIDLRYSVHNILIRKPSTTSSYQSSPASSSRILVLRRLEL